MVVGGRGFDHPTELLAVDPGFACGRISVRRHRTSPIPWTILRVSLDRGELDPNRQGVGTCSLAS